MPIPAIIAIAAEEAIKAFARGVGEEFGKAVGRQLGLLFAERGGQVDFNWLVEEFARQVEDIVHSALEEQEISRIGSDLNAIPQMLDFNSALKPDEARQNCRDVYNELVHIKTRVYS